MRPSATAARAEELRRAIEDANHRYHVLDEPAITDAEYDALMRRLRENSTLETEIKKTGEVVVEGHEIGRLDGFTFVADASAAGSEAKALQAAARTE